MRLSVPGRSTTRDQSHLGARGRGRGVPRRRSAPARAASRRRCGAAPASRPRRGVVPSRVGAGRLRGGEVVAAVVLDAEPLSGVGEVQPGQAPVLVDDRVLRYRTSAARAAVRTRRPAARPPSTRRHRVRSGPQVRRERAEPQVATPVGGLDVGVGQHAFVVRTPQPPGRDQTGRHRGRPAEHLGPPRHGHPPMVGARPPTADRDPAGPSRS